MDAINRSDTIADPAHSNRAAAKAPAESRGPWDYLKLVTSTPAEQAFRPLNEGGCPLVRA